MPVSASPLRAVRMNSPLGTRPSAAARFLWGSLKGTGHLSFRARSLCGLAQQLLDESFQQFVADFAVIVLQLWDAEQPRPFAGAVEDKDARHSCYAEFLFPEPLFLIEVDVDEAAHLVGC